MRMDLQQCISPNYSFHHHFHVSSNPVYHSYHSNQSYHHHLHSNRFHHHYCPHSYSQPCDRHLTNKRDSTRSPVSSDMRSTINLYKKIVSDIHRLERYINGKDPFFSNGPPKQSKCIVDFINSRTSGNSILERASLSKEFVINNLLSNNVLRERQYSVGQLDKIFCSQWLNHRQIIFGTKCNMLMVLDLHTSKLVQIPNLSSSSNLNSSQNTRCGIHCIAINPSRTLLAAGGENPNDIAIYKLPTLDPIGVGEGAHTDWIFDACWLDGQQKYGEINVQTMFNVV